MINAFCEIKLKRILATCRYSSSRCLANMAHMSRSRLWLSDNSPETVLSFALFARERTSSASTPSIRGALGPQMSTSNSLLRVLRFRISALRLSGFGSLPSGLWGSVRCPQAFEMKPESLRAGCSALRLSASVARSARRCPRPTACAQCFGIWDSDIEIRVSAALRALPCSELISQKVFVKTFCTSQFPHKSVNLSSAGARPADVHVQQPAPRVSGLRIRGSDFGVSGFEFRVSGFGFRVSGFGFMFRVPGSGFRDSGFGFRDSGFGFRDSDPGFRDSGFESWNWGFGFRVSGSEFQVSDFGIWSSGFSSPAALPRAWPRSANLSHITYYQQVLESQLPHKIVNFLFTITDSNIKLTISWES